jgi:hypothetical protein
MPPWGAALGVNGGMAESRHGPRDPLEPVSITLNKLKKHTVEGQTRTRTLYAYLGCARRLEYYVYVQ